MEFWEITCEEFYRNEAERMMEELSNDEEFQKWLEENTTYDLEEREI